MRKFVVPQFIDIEDKIIGPITTRQFIIIIVSSILIFLAYRLSSFNLFLVQAIGIGLIGGSLAFLKINGTNFHIFLLNLISSLAKPSLRVWGKEMLKEVVPKDVKKGDLDSDMFVPKKSIAPGKLSELALIVDTGGMYKGEEEANFINQAVYGK